MGGGGESLYTLPRRGTPSPERACAALLLCGTYLFPIQLKSLLLHRNYGIGAHRILSSSWVLLNCRLSVELVSPSETVAQQHSREAHAAGKLRDSSLQRSSSALRQKKPWNCLTNSRQLSCIAFSSSVFILDCSLYL